MSESNVRNLVVITERHIITQLLQLYKKHPCLWDQMHELYGNKDARAKAYEELLEKYTECQENATIQELKKKIEHLRCAYRRERNKVRRNKFKGIDYKPHLWYYNLLTFLDDNHQLYMERSKIEYEESSQVQEILDSEESEDEHIPKRKKSDPDNSTNSVYLEEHIIVEQEPEALTSDLLEPIEQPQPYIINNEAESFGRTIGFQLKGLGHMQRVFAEKLISDVIYQARLGNLNFDTTLTDNN